MAARPNPTSSAARAAAGPPADPTPPVTGEGRGPAGDPHAPAWSARAEELADWAAARIVVRTDRFGGYYRNRAGATRFAARPNQGAPKPFGRDTLVRHFRAAGPADVIAAYPLTEGGGRWAGVDLDAHGPADDPARNAGYAAHLHGKLAALGLRPLLLTWGGGGYHLWVLFDRDVPGPDLYAFARWAVADAAAWGYPEPPEAFPKQAAVGVGGRSKLGSCLRLPGRHHTRPVFATVFNGVEWVIGEAAVAHVLSLTGDPPDRIPAEARPAPRSRRDAARPTAPATPPGGRPARGGRPDVFAAYNATVTLGQVADWHEAAGHRVVRRTPERVEFARDGKDGPGASFNVALVDGVPVTFCFSPNARLPAGRGLSPAQVRCLYESGECGPAAMKRFAAALRAEFGWATPRVAATGVTQAGARRPDPLAGLQFTDTDLANAARFVARYRGAAVFVADWKRWAVFDGLRWVIDPTGAAAAGLAHQTLRRMADEAAARVGEAAQAVAAATTPGGRAAAELEQAEAQKALRWAKRSQDAKKVTAMLEIARTSLLLPVGGDVFDRRPHLLNCPNGTVDLRTGELRPHAAADYLTKLCPTRYDPAADRSAYLAFLASVFPDPAVAGYVRRVGGAGATGEVADQALYLFHGGGANGKSTLLDLWVAVLGDGEYAVTAPSELVADRGEDRHPTEKTVLRAAHLAVCQETGDGEALNAKRVKLLTGGSRVSARGMKQDFYTFDQTHTLVLATNHLPRVRAADHATWRRIRVVTFPRVFWTEADRAAAPAGDYPPELRSDPGLPGRLRAGAEGVLADLVDQAGAFYAAGCRIEPPPAAAAATAAYREDEDHVGRFLRDRLEPTAPGRGLRGGALYAAFQAWYRAEVHPEGKDCPGSRAVYAAAAARYGEPRKIGGYMRYAARHRGPGDAGCE